MSAVSDVYLHFHPEAAVEETVEEPTDNRERIAELNGWIEDAEDQISSLLDEIAEWSQELRGLESEDPTTLDAWRKKLDSWNGAAAS